MNDDILNQMIEYVADIKRFHAYCDPYDMFPEDIEAWYRWDKIFNPEKYNEE